MLSPALSPIARTVRAGFDAQLDLFADTPDLPVEAAAPAVMDLAHLEGGNFAGHTPGQPAVPLYIAFSGGKTSAMMTEIILRDYSHRFNPVFITFANTGQEHAKTIEFVYECQQRWERLYGTTVVWLEAVVNHAGRGRGYGTTYKIVDYYSATMHWNWNGPFTEVITKYGLPSPASPNVCNRELKLAPQYAYRRNIEKMLGLKNVYTAIGIRDDEPHRHQSAEEQRKGKFCYPMVDLFQSDKQDVADFWEDMDFALGIPEELGNCVTCWKKSVPKLGSVANTNPNYFTFFDIHEQVNGRTNVPDDAPARTLFRNHLSAEDIINITVMDADYKDIKAQAAARRLAAKAGDNDFSGCTSECQPFANAVDLVAELEDADVVLPSDMLPYYQPTLAQFAQAAH